MKCLRVCFLFSRVFVDCFVSKHVVVYIVFFIHLFNYASIIAKHLTIFSMKIGMLSVTCLINEIIIWTRIRIWFKKNKWKCIRNKYISQHNIYHLDINWIIFFLFLIWTFTHFAHIQYLISIQPQNWDIFLAGQYTQSNYRSQSSEVFFVWICYI